MTEPGESAASLTLCVCSARPELVAANLDAWRAALGPADELLVVLDTPDGAPGGRAGRNGHAPGPLVNMVSLGAHRGLSSARMRGLEAALATHVVFMDDDALAPTATVEAIRRAVAAGANVVGVRLEPAFASCTRPWYLIDGLLHYVGVHSEATLGTVWGACFAVDREFARAKGLRFRPELGRRGRQLQSGDDSSFVTQVRERGGDVVFLPDCSAIHSIGVEKCTLRYLLRRAWWQGRSEVRRGSWRAGLAKELRRIRSGGPAHARLALVPAFGAAVAIGIATELALVRRAGFAGSRYELRSREPA